MKNNIKNNLKESNTSFFPKNILKPIFNALSLNLKVLERRKRDIEEEDPFANKERSEENASPDTDAEEQFGHARTGAIKTEIERKIIQTRKALTRIKIGKYGLCEDCSSMIDTDRLVIYPEASLCAKCQVKHEASE